MDLLCTRWPAAKGVVASVPLQSLPGAECRGLNEGATRAGRAHKWAPSQVRDSPSVEAGSSLWAGLAQRWAGWRRARRRFASGGRQCGADGTGLRGSCGARGGQRGHRAARALTHRQTAGAGTAHTWVLNAVPAGRVCAGQCALTEAALLCTCPVESTARAVLHAVRQGNMRWLCFADCWNDRRRFGPC